LSSGILARLGGVGVIVGVAVSVGVAVGVFVAVATGVLVAVEVGVAVDVETGVTVAGGPIVAAGDGVFVGTNSVAVATTATNSVVGSNDSGAGAVLQEMALIISKKRGINIFLIIGNL
jgi:hypothetical protein